MRLGSYQIQGLSKRFWVIASAILALFLALPEREAPADPFTTPAIPVSELAEISRSADTGWFAELAVSNGILRPASYAPLTTFYDQYAGQPMRFRVYLPSVDEFAERPDLVLNQYGWNFVPAAFIDPTTVFDIDIRDRLVAGLSEQAPVQLGFRQGNAPAPSNFYEVTGLLWWNSAQLRAPDPEAGMVSSPTVLVSDFQSLAEADVRSPATHRADLNLVYRGGGMALIVHSVEWSAGRELRACVSIHNRSKGTLDLWGGVFDSEADYGEGSKLSYAGEYSQFEQSYLASRQTLTDYILFEGQPSGAPTQELTLHLPSPNPRSNDIAVVVKPRQFHELGLGRGTSNAGRRCAPPS